MILIAIIGIIIFYIDYLAGGSLKVVEWSGDRYALRKGRVFFRYKDTTGNVWRERDSILFKRCICTKERAEELREEEGWGKPV